MTVINDLKLLLWKNYILQIRHPIVTIAEILIPCLFAAMLASIRGKVEFTDHTNATVFDSFDTFNIPELKISSGMSIPYWIVMYAPNTSRIESIVEKATNKLQTGFVTLQCESKNLIIDHNFLTFSNVFIDI